MSRHPLDSPAPRRPRRRGFTLVEASLAIVLVAILAAGALEAAAASVRAQQSLRDRQFAARLAESLLAEVSAKRYTQPADLTGLLATVTDLFDRSNLLSLDSFLNFTESPPRSADGTQITTASGWTRSVTVTYVLPTDPTQTSLVDLGLRRITVTVSRNGTTLATRTTLRATD